MFLITLTKRLQVFGGAFTKFVMRTGAIIFLFPRRRIFVREKYAWRKVTSSVHGGSVYSARGSFISFRFFPWHFFFENRFPRPIAQSVNCFGIHRIIGRFIHADRFVAKSSLVSFGRSIRRPKGRRI